MSPKARLVITGPAALTVGKTTLSDAERDLLPCATVEIKQESFRVAGRKGSNSLSTSADMKGKCETVTVRTWGGPHACQPPDGQRTLMRLPGSL